MIDKLPRWVEVGGFLLALNAGFINAIAVLGFKHQAVSHMTGTSTLLSIAVVQHNGVSITQLVLVMLSFVLGAAFSGAIIGNTALSLGRPYSVALICEALLLAVATYFLTQSAIVGHLFASAACGLQNAITSTYSGAIVRTTHVSGLFTDLGIALGLRLRGQAFHSRKITLYLLLIAGFVLGGVVGGFSFLRFGFAALAMASVLTASLGIGYWLMVHVKRQA